MEENKYISELLKEIQIEKAPDGVTQKIMQQIAFRVITKQKVKWWQMPVFYVIALIGVSRLVFIYFLENYVSMEMIVSKFQEYTRLIMLKIMMLGFQDILFFLGLLALLVYLFVEDTKERSCCGRLPFA